MYVQTKLPFPDILCSQDSVAEGPEQVSNMPHYTVKGAHVCLGNYHGVIITTIIKSEYTAPKLQDICS